MALVVCWQNDVSNCQSVTAWSGQAQNINGEDRITAMWLFTVETSPEEDWYATHIGHDIFTRVRPTEQTSPLNVGSVALLVNKPYR